MNTKQKKFYSLLSAIHYQTARGQHTWSVGECGHMARGGRTCSECLLEKMSNVIGDYRTLVLSDAMDDYNEILIWVDEELE